jgi:N-acetylmuramoyl-L-alanine amidase
MKLILLILAVVIIQRIIPICAWRTGEKIKPTYITIHATDNWSNGAGALRHSIALHKGIRSKRTYVSWHYTVDSLGIVQNLPDQERGVHCGPGNRRSIGIEMCLNRDGKLPVAILRTAELTAQLMKVHRVPISRVVPHYFWTSKPCPSVFMTNRRPGAKWETFLKLVRSYTGRGVKQYR